MFSVKRSLVGLIALSLGLLCAWMPNVSQAQKECAAMKRYYLSANMVKGNEVTKVCREGFHTASLWELFDTSNLEYATEFGDGSLGLEKGSGPPSGVYGWVRTGWAPGFGGTGSRTPGQAHCFLWTSDSSSFSGTRIRLANDWRKKWPPISRIGPWEAESKKCNNRDRVWCMQD